MPPRKPNGIDVRKNSDGTTSYRVRWKEGGGRNGRQLSHSFRTRSEALDAQRSIELAGWHCYCDKHAPEGTLPGHFGTPGKTPEETWGGYARKQIETRPGISNGHRAQLARELDLHLSPLLNRPIGEIDRDVVQTWVRGLERNGLKASTIHRLTIAAGSIQRAAIDVGLATTNPFGRIRSGRRDRDKHTEMVTLTHEEWARLRAALPEGVYRDLATTLIGTGMRWSEATALAVGAVDLDSTPPRLHVARAWKHDGKGGYEMGVPKSARSRRTITFSSAVADALRRQIEGKADDELVFTGPRGGQILNQNFRSRIWIPAVERAGLDRRPRIHDCRHTHVSWLIAAGRPAPAISRRLGHQSIQTTVDEYGHLLPSVDLEDVVALEQAMPLEDAG